MLQIEVKLVNMFSELVCNEETFQKQKSKLRLQLKNNSAQTNCNTQATVERHYFSAMKTPGVWWGGDGVPPPSGVARGGSGGRGHRAAPFEGRHFAD